MQGADLARKLFQETFDSEPESIAFAPGRVNLIGEHTDYNDGFVFPAAIHEGVYVAARRTLHQTRIISGEFGAGESFSAATGTSPDLANFARYPAGVAWALGEAGHVPTNLEASVCSDLPIGAGVSSSSALEIAFATIWNHVGGFRLGSLDLAELCKRCENGFIGVQSGIMDPLASALGREGCAMLIDTRSLDVRYVKIPDGLALALCDTGLSRSLDGSAYNERRTQCEAGCLALGVRTLRDVSLDQLESAEQAMEPLIFRRSRHVVSENQRCLEFVEALERGDLGRLGRLMLESHESLRDDYEVTGPALDAMADACRQAPGCIGARMTGAGFGGACIAVVQANKFGEFRDRTLDHFSDFSDQVTIRKILPADGAKLLLE